MCDINIKNVEKLGDIVNQCKNTYHKTIKMKPIDVKSSTYIDFGVENNNKDSKVKVGDHLRIKMLLQKI